MTLLRFVGNEPYRLVIKGVVYDLKKGDEVEVPDKSIKFQKMRLFVNVLKESKLKQESLKVKEKIKELEGGIKKLKDKDKP